jgi:hypothetical protein
MQASRAVQRARRKPTDQSIRPRSHPAQSGRQGGPARRQVCPSSRQTRDEPKRAHHPSRSCWPCCAPTARWHGCFRREGQSARTARHVSASETRSTSAESIADTGGWHRQSRARSWITPLWHSLQSTVTIGVAGDRDGPPFAALWGSESETAPSAGRRRRAELPTGQNRPSQTAQHSWMQLCVSAGRAWPMPVAPKGAPSTPLRRAWSVATTSQIRDRQRAGRLVDLLP